MQTEWISGHELAEWLKLGRDTVNRCVAAGDLPPGIRIGRQYRWNKATVVEHLERRAAEAAAAAAGADDDHTDAPADDHEADHGGTLQVIGAGGSTY